MSCHDGVVPPPGYRPTILGYPDLLKLATAQGLTPERADIAAAIALAESNGRTSAVHIADGGTDCNSYGVWQIQSCCGRDKGGVRLDKVALLTADGNARAMASISGKGANFGPWSTYKNGAYRKFLGGAGGGRRSSVIEGPRTPITIDVDQAYSVATGVPEPIVGAAHVIANNVPDVLKTGAAAVVGTAEFLARLADPALWSRLAYYIGGGVIIILGVVVINRDTFVSTAAKLAPVI